MNKRVIAIPSIWPTFPQQCYISVFSSVLRWYVAPPGLRTLELLLRVGMDIEEFMPQMFCRLAAAYAAAENVFESDNVATSEHL